MPHNQRNQKTSGWVILSSLLAFWIATISIPLLDKNILGGHPKSLSTLWIRNLGCTVILYPIVWLKKGRLFCSFDFEPNNPYRFFPLLSLCLLGASLLQLTVSFESVRKNGFFQRSFFLLLPFTIGVSYLSNGAQVKGVSLASCFVVLTGVLTGVGGDLKDPVHGLFCGAINALLLALYFCMIAVCLKSVNESPLNLCFSYSLLTTLVLLPCNVFRPTLCMY